MIQENREYKIKITDEDLKMLAKVYDIVQCSSRLLAIDEQVILDFRDWLDEHEAWGKY